MTRRMSAIFRYKVLMEALLSKRERHAKATVIEQQPANRNRDEKYLFGALARCRQEMTDAERDEVENLYSGK